MQRVLNSLGCHQDMNMILLFPIVEICNYARVYGHTRGTWDLPNVGTTATRPAMLDYKAHKSQNDENLFDFTPSIEKRIDLFYELQSVWSKKGGSGFPT